MKKPLSSQFKISSRVAPSSYILPDPGSVTASAYIAYAVHSSCHVMRDGQPVDTLRDSKGSAHATSQKCVKVQSKLSWTGVLLDLDRPQRVHRRLGSV